MRLYAVVVPPIEEVRKLLRVVGARADDSLTWLPVDTVRVGLCYFGNLIHSDLMRLTPKLSTEVAGISAFRLRLAGGDALVEEGDDSVWVSLDGDLDQLKALAVSVGEVARRDGFAVDRRSYHPRARIARIGPATTAPGLQKTLDRLQAYVGAPWSATEVVIAHERATTDTSGFPVLSTLHSLPLQHSTNG
jgi:RNA 2',3'-cyclic 3'-phosphodiesterase